MVIMEDERDDITHTINRLILPLLNRVLRAGIVRNVAGTTPKSSEQRLVEKIAGRPNVVARSEVTVTPKEAQSLTEEILKAQKFIVQHREEVSESFNRPPGTTYRYRQGGVVYESDSGAIVGANEPGLKVMVGHRTENFDITIAFNFEGEFSLEIVSPDPADSSKRAQDEYDSGQQPTKEMTREEFDISRAYLSLLR